MDHLISGRQVSDMRSVCHINFIAADRARAVLCTNDNGWCPSLALFVVRAILIGNTTIVLISVSSALMESSTCRSNFRRAPDKSRCQKHRRTWMIIHRLVVSAWMPEGSSLSYK